MKATDWYNHLVKGESAKATQKQASYQTGSYQLDMAHSKVGFEVAHLVISTVEGKFNKAEAQLDLAAEFENSKLRAIVDVGSIDTGVSMRDDHLRSADFFDALKHPQLIFVSSVISGSPEAFKLSGALTIKGTTKEVTFDGQYLGTVVDGYDQRKVAFRAKTKINRRDFGLTWGQLVEVGPVVGDQVTIDLRIQAALKS